MRALLDDEALQGVHQTRITFRPSRVANAIWSEADFLKTVQHSCQIWSGATAPIIPATPSDSIPDEYLAILPGSHVDRLDGLQDSRGLKQLARTRGEVYLNRDARPNFHGQQFAPALLKLRKQDRYRTLRVAEFNSPDPWRGIYSACLGSLPERPDPRLLDEGQLVDNLRFEDFVRITRIPTRGSLDNLLENLTSEFLTPRKLSMVHLPYGNRGNSAIRSSTGVLPEPWYPSFDAGPNILVVCTPGDPADLALLWNLRAAHGDGYILPIGLPIDEFTSANLQTLTRHEMIARDGTPSYDIYATSTSISTETLTMSISDFGIRRVTAVEPSALLTFGPAAGFRRDEPVVWERGIARFVPFPPGTKDSLFEARGMSRSLRMHWDLEVPDLPFPSAPRLRIDGETMGQFYSGRLSGWINPRDRTSIREERWPSRLLIARAVASGRGLELTESEPGRSARVALADLSDLSAIGYLAHAPLLTLLEELAARQGFSWYKDRLRRSGNYIDSSTTVAATSEELPEMAFGQFKRAFSNSEKATRVWLLWAERAGLIIKGFPLSCDFCRAKQWIPIAGFSPPIVCRGCAKEMKTPFGDRPVVTFTYRMSERLRRVFQHDAVGHLLAARFFDQVLGGGQAGRVIGLHPGIEVSPSNVSGEPLGEADVLILTRAGDLIPVELKRTPTGFTDGELSKLDALSSALGAPWSATVFCGYEADFPDSPIPLESRRPGAQHFRLSLSWDRLLDLEAYWFMGDDPFNTTPLSREEIRIRESAYVSWLSTHGDAGPSDWLTQNMIDIST